VSVILSTLRLDILTVCNAEVSGAATKNAMAVRLFLEPGTPACFSFSNNVFQLPVSQETETERDRNRERVIEDFVA